MARKISVEIVGNADDLSRALGRASKQTKGFGSELGRFAKVGGLALGAAGVGGALAILKTGFDEMKESAQVMAQTGAVLKSTGGAANVTGQDVASLAESLMKMSGVDDEAIQSGENMLLTFTKIRNEVGKGNDVFNQATQATLDLSVAMGKDMQSSALLVGKALNDPIKGMGALSRAGIQFTADQKEMIKGMVEAGDTMGAQKMILGELETQFGGSAEAMGKTLPGQIAILKESFSNVSGEIVTKMIPALTSAVAFVRDHWPEISTAVKGVWDAVKPILTQLGAAFTAVADIVKDHWPFISRNLKAVQTVVEDVAKIIAASLKLVVDLLNGDWSKAWGDIKTIVGASMNAAKTVITNTLTNIGELLLGGVKAIGEGAEAIGKAIVKGISDGLAGLAEALKTLVRAPLNGLIDAWNDIGIPSFSVGGWDPPGPGPKIPGFTIPALSLPDIPRLDTGGLIAKSGLAVVHKGETVVPRGRGGDINVTVNIPNYVGSKEELGRFITSALVRANRRGSIHASDLL